MALQTYSLIPRRTKKTHRLKKNEFNVMIPNIDDLGRVIQEITALQVKGQIAIGNPPQNIIVDNSGTKPFKDADFRIQTIFANPEDVARAVLDVVINLKKLTRVLTGASRGSYEIWKVSGTSDGGVKVLGNANAGLTTLITLSSDLKAGERLVVVGPTTDYGRKLYWRPKGKFKGRASRKAAYNADTGKTDLVRGSRSTNMRDLVLGRVKRKHKGVIVIGRWVKREGKRWPGIAVGLSTKGSVR